MSELSMGSDGGYDKMSNVSDWFMNEISSSPPTFTFLHCDLPNNAHQVFHPTLTSFI
jgi:hypothetical protein